MILNIKVILYLTCVILIMPRIRVFSFWWNTMTFIVESQLELVYNITWNAKSPVNLGLTQVKKIHTLLIPFMINVEIDTWYRKTQICLMKEIRKEVNLKWKFRLHFKKYDHKLYWLNMVIYAQISWCISYITKMIQSTTSIYTYIVQIVYV